MKKNKDMGMKTQFHASFEEEICSFYKQEQQNTAFIIIPIMQAPNVPVG